MRKKFLLAFFAVFIIAASCSCSRNVNINQTKFLDETGQTVIITHKTVNGRTTITRDTL